MSIQGFDNVKKNIAKLRAGHLTRAQRQEHELKLNADVDRIAAEIEASSGKAIADLFRKEIEAAKKVPPALSPKKKPKSVLRGGGATSSDPISGDGRQVSRDGSSSLSSREDEPTVPRNGGGAAPMDPISESYSEDSSGNNSDSDSSFGASDFGADSGSLPVSDNSGEGLHSIVDSLDDSSDDSSGSEPSAYEQSLQDAKARRARDDGDEEVAQPSISRRGGAGSPERGRSASSPTMRKKKGKGKGKGRPRTVSRPGGAQE